jgi:phosphate:Na+ symporter
MDLAAKKTALSHFLFNAGGVLLFLPLLYAFGDELGRVETSPAVALANIHLVFNVATSVLFTAVLTPFTRLVDRLLGEGSMDFERIEIPAVLEETPFEEIRLRLQANLGALLAFLQENYNLVTLSIESNYRRVFDTASKRIDYVDFLEREHLATFSHVVGRVTDEAESAELLALITRYDYLFQIHDSIDDLFATKRSMNEHYIELESDVLLLVRDISSRTLALFEAVREALKGAADARVAEEARDLQVLLADVNRRLLRLLADVDRRDAGALSNFVTYSRRLGDKLVSFTRLTSSGDDEA